MTVQTGTSDSKYVSETEKMNAQGKEENMNNKPPENFNEDLVPGIVNAIQKLPELASEIQPLIPILERDFENEGIENPYESIDYFKMLENRRFKGYPYFSQRVLISENEFESLYYQFEKNKYNPQEFQRVYLGFRDEQISRMRGINPDGVEETEAAGNAHPNMYSKFRKTFLERLNLPESDPSFIRLKFEHLPPKPVLKMLLTKVGAVLDIGWCWYPGKNRAADIIKLRIHNGFLQRIVIKRRDHDNAAGIPGGMLEVVAKGDSYNFENEKMTAIRESKEEGGGGLRRRHYMEMILREIPNADLRTTVLAMFTTSLLVIIPEGFENSIEPETPLDPNIEIAEWRNIDENLVVEELTKGIPGHAYLDFFTLKYLQDKFAIIVAVDGRVYKMR